MPSKKVKGITPTRKMENAYAQAIQKDIIAPLMSGLNQRLQSVPAIKAAYLRAIEQEIAITLAAEDLGLGIATTALDNIRKFQKAKLINMFRSALGVDINPFMSDLNIRPIMRTALTQNLALIKSIPEQLRPQLLKNIANVFDTKGFDQQAIVRELQGRFKVAKNRAKFIARDQTSKIIGDLNEKRQTDLGITSYIWQTSEDERVVGTPGGLYPEGNPGHMNHFVRNGKEFLWAVPPPDGHPGQAYNCRCTAIPVIPEAQEEINEAA